MRTQYNRNSRDTDRVGTLYHELRTLAYSRGPRTKLPTVQEMRETYGVSQATITGALDRLEAQNIVTRKDRHGIYVSPAINRKHIRVLMDASQVDGRQRSPFWAMFWGLLVQEAQGRADHKDEEIGYHLVNPQVYRRDITLPEDILRMLDDGLVHGVLCTGMRSSNTKVFLDADHGIPLVSFAGDGYWQVNINRKGIYELLIPELAARGCKTVAYWHATHDFDYDFELDNIEHARITLARHGITLRDQDVHGAVCKDNVTPQHEGYRMVMEAFDGGHAARPDGILIGDDMITAGALAAMHRLGIMPGRDVIIGTHANKGSTVLLGYEDLLVRAEFDALDIVRAMFAKLDLLLEGKRPEERFTIVEPRLGV
jgi:hypothetical protein